MISPNALKMWLDFYQQNPQVQGTDYSSHSGFNPSPFNRNADAMQFAQQMIGQGGGNARPNDGGNTGMYATPPDFFGGLPQGQGGLPPQQGYNRLAMLMRGR